jgi:hypothetical protein
MNAIPSLTDLLNGNASVVNHNGLRSRAKRDGLKIVSVKPDWIERGQRSDTRIVALVRPEDPTTIWREKA